MSKQVDVNIPKWFELDGLSTIHTIISPHSKEYGVLVAGENLDNSKYCNPTVRIYLMNLHNGKYELKKELEAFTFNSQKEAIKFTEQFPKLNAIDLVMFLNKEETLYSYE